MKAIRSFLIGIAVVATSSAMAQLGAGMGGMQPPSMEYNTILLMDPNVQKDLALSPEVSGKVSKAVQESLMKMMPAMMGPMSGKKMSADEQAKFGKGMLEAYSETQKKALVYLNARQKARLHQITLQTFGPIALTDAKVQTEVGLTSGQKSKLSAKYAAVSMEMTQEMKKYYDPSKGMDTANMGPMISAYKASQKKMKAGYRAAMDAVLTPAQKAKWASMQGKHIELGMIGQMASGNIGG